jgi:hypothetical protein
VVAATAAKDVWLIGSLVAVVTVVMFSDRYLGQT